MIKSKSDLKAVWDKFTSRVYPCRFFLLAEIEGIPVESKPRYKTAL